MEEQKKSYEIGFVSNVEEGKAQIEKTIKDLQGEITREGENLRLRLMYPINKQTTGFFCYIQFMMESVNIDVLKKTLKLNAAVLRFLVIKPTENKQRETFQPEKEAKRERVVSVAPVELPSRRPTDSLSNEELERKIEEILQ